MEGALDTEPADAHFEETGGWTEKNKAKITDKNESKEVPESMGGVEHTTVKVLSPETQPDFRFKVKMSICLHLRHWEPKSPKLPGMGVSFVISTIFF